MEKILYHMDTVEHVTIEDFDSISIIKNELLGRNILEDIVLGRVDSLVALPLSFALNTRIVRYNVLRIFTGVTNGNKCHSLMRSEYHVHFHVYLHFRI